MSLWQKLQTPPSNEPKFMALVALGTFVLMLLTSPFWAANSMLVVICAGGFCGFVAVVLAKLLMGLGR